MTFDLSGSTLKASERTDDGVFLSDLSLLFIAQVSSTSSILSAISCNIHEKSHHFSFSELSTGLSTGSSTGSFTGLSPSHSLIKHFNASNV